MRIKKLPKGTVSFHTQTEQHFLGVVEKEATAASNGKTNASPNKGKEKVGDFLKHLTKSYLTICFYYTI